MEGVQSCQREAYSSRLGSADPSLGHCHQEAEIWPQEAEIAENRPANPERHRRAEQFETEPRREAGVVVDIVAGSPRKSCRHRVYR